MEVGNDLRTVIKEIDTFADVVPQEDVLRVLIEGDTLDILVVGEASTEADYKIVLESLKMYCTWYGSNVKMRFVGDFLVDGKIRQMIHSYGLDDVVEFANEMSVEMQLSYYLGSQIVLVQGEGTAHLKAQFFYQSIIGFGAGDGCAEGILWLPKDPVEVAAALHVLKDNYEHRNMLAKDGRSSFDKVANAMRICAEGGK